MRDREVNGRLIKGVGSAFIWSARLRSQQRLMLSERPTCAWKIKSALGGGGGGGGGGV